MVLDWLLADLAWEMRRYRRMKSFSLFARAREGYDNKYLSYGAAHQDTIAKLRPPFSEIDVAAAFAGNMQTYDDFEQLLISFEKRFNKIFREISSSRRISDKRQRKAVDRILACQSGSIAPAPDADAQAGKDALTKKTVP